MADGKNPLPAKDIGGSVLRQADKGNIILLHDGGGERAQTVAALPQIIDALRAKGYQFVSVSDLIGMTRAQVMLPLSGEERFESRADAFFFTLYHCSLFFICLFFISAILLVLGPP